MAQATPQLDRKRVKVYELRNNDWFDRGTGLCSATFVTSDDGEVKEPRVIVESEDDPGRMLLDTHVTREDGFQRQQDTLIVWTDQSTALEMALSFQEAEGCLLIWTFISDIQQSLAAAVPDDSLSEDLAVDMSPGISLPPAELGALQDLETTMRVMSSTPDGRDALASCIMSDDYIRKLIPLLDMAEDLESLTDLHHLCNIVKTILLLNDTGIIEHAVSDECVMGVVGALEYDPDFPSHKANHRHWLNNQGRYKEVVRIQDDAIRKKIHQTYRLQYLKDVVLARILDDPTFSVLNSLIFFNQVDIVQHLQTNAGFLGDLFGIFTDPTEAVLRKKQAVLFIQQCCTIAKNLQPPARIALYNNFISHGLLHVINFGLRNKDVSVRVGATDILVSMIDHDPHMIRMTVYRQLQDNQPLLTDTLIDLLLVEVDLGIKSQVSDALKVILDRVSPNQLAAAAAAEAAEMASNGGHVTNGGDIHNDDDDNHDDDDDDDDEGSGNENDDDDNDDDEVDDENRIEGSDAASSIAAAAAAAAAAASAAARRGGQGRNKAMSKAMRAKAAASHAAELQMQQQARMMIEPQQDLFLDHFYESSAARLFRPLLELEHQTELKFDVLNDGIFSYLNDILCFFIRQHQDRCKFFLLQNDVSLRFVQLLGCRVKHLQLVAVRFFRHMVAVRDDFYNRHIVDKRLMEPIFDLLERCLPRDNLVCSVCLEFFDAFTKDNLGDLHTHLVEAYHDRIEALSYLPTFNDLLHRRNNGRLMQQQQIRYQQQQLQQQQHQQQLQQQQQQQLQQQQQQQQQQQEQQMLNAHADQQAAENSQGGARSTENGRRGMHGGDGPLLGPIELDPESEEYWNGDDVDDEGDEDGPALRRVWSAGTSRPGSAPGDRRVSDSPVLKQLVDYASDDEEEDADEDTAEGVPAEGALGLATPLSPVSPLLSGTPPERVSEKRRREEEEEEDEMGRLLTQSIKRRNSRSTSTGSDDGRADGPATTTNGTNGTSADGHTNGGSPNGHANANAAHAAANGRIKVQLSNGHVGDEATTSPAKKISINITSSALKTAAAVPATTLGGMAGKADEADERVQQAAHVV